MRPYRESGPRPSRRPDPQRNPRPGPTLSPATRNVLLAVLGVALVAAIALTTVGVVVALRNSSGGASIGRSGSAGSPAALATVTTPAEATTNPNATASPTPKNAPFVCANPAGSSTTYVFVNADHQLYRVTSCSTPVQLTHLDAATTVTPLAFSPSEKSLMVNIGPAQQPDSGGPPTCQQLMNAQTGALTKTTYCEDMSLSPSYPIDRLIAWVDDTTFLEAQYADKASPIKILRVNASTLASSVVTSLTWVAGSTSVENGTGIVLRGGYLYYGGYRSQSESGGYLHRYSLSTGTDTSLVNLGIATSGPCQVYDGPCNWTGPWDISRDGSTIVYHNPPPTVEPSDTSAPPETPLYVAHADGTSAKQITNPPSNSGQYLSNPQIAPSGGWVVGSQGQRPVLIPADGSMTSVQLPNDYQFAGWRTDGTALLSTNGPNYTQRFALYILSTKSITNLADYTRLYVWAS